LEDAKMLILLPLVVLICFTAASPYSNHKPTLVLLFLLFHVALTWLITGPFLAASLQRPVGALECDKESRHHEAHVRTSSNGSCEVKIFMWLSIMLDI
jgi:hypothetical protein